jgi:hypothetical protein
MLDNVRGQYENVAADHGSRGSGVELPFWRQGQPSRGRAQGADRKGRRLRYSALNGHVQAMEPSAFGRFVLRLVLGTLGLYKILSTSSASSWEDGACPQLF